VGGVGGERDRQQPLLGGHGDLHNLGRLGGWYDHVAPPQVLVNCAQWGCGYVYGFRVPLIVISPYVKAQHISHTPHDFGSILKFMEVTFTLPSLGNADVAADDFSDCFDFNQNTVDV